MLAFLQQFADRFHDPATAMTYLVCVLALLVALYALRVVAIVLKRRR